MTTIRANFSVSDVRAMLEKKFRALDLAIIEALFDIGNACYSEATEQGSYKNRTGRLRSSVGFAVVKDGTIVKQGGFDTFLEGSEGSSKGKAYLESLLPSLKKGYCLLFVVGEDYAAYVESRGLNVISSAHSLGKLEFPKAIKKIKSLIKKM